MDFVEKKIDFIHKFIKASNPATGSEVDSNANVTVKSIAVMEAELFKREFIAVNRAMVMQKLEDMYDYDLAKQYAKDIEEHLIYIHDETSLRPYCVSISLYPFLLEGTKNLGGTSKAPTNLQSFCGSFVNLVYQIASDFAGAVATVEFLMYFDYFARKQYGYGYLAHHYKEIAQEFQGVVYAMNQPAAARGSQSVFWNISIFDEQYFESLFGSFYFPDGTKPDYNSVRQLQEMFLYWFTQERTKELLTFPVLTAAYLVDKDKRKPIDTGFEYVLAKAMSDGLSFFHYESDSADSLASCCRLRNELADNTFSYTLGAGGVSTGSYQVITINFNRMYQRGYELSEVVQRVQKYLLAFRSIVGEYIEAGLLPTYSAGYISLDKQFGTIGINGALEAYEYMKANGYQNTFKEHLQMDLSIIKTLNKEALAKYGVRFNTEFVPKMCGDVKLPLIDMKTLLRATWGKRKHPKRLNEVTLILVMRQSDPQYNEAVESGSSVKTLLEEPTPPVRGVIYYAYL